MIPALHVLAMARSAGVTVHLEGQDLLLQAAAAPPPDVLRALVLNKMEIISYLRQPKPTWTSEDWWAWFEEHAAIAEVDGGLVRRAAEAQAFASCVDQWLRHYPTCQDPYDQVHQALKRSGPRGQS
jgi:hypothetical protein